MKRIFGFLLSLLVMVTFAVPAAHAEGGSVLLSKTGRLSITPATTAEEVVGFDYIQRVLGEDYCVSYYAANPPLIGMTQPVKIKCPLGIQDIPKYKVKYKQAIDLFQRVNCGDAFDSISLSWPVTPEVPNPIWRLRSNLGSEVIIDAENGELKCQ
ncbi:MAG: hypothetical protein QNJ36_08640 [Calothrix sp. MO_167.B42]|nr:hypothetical protein [Calothrix sp. MO_167.B42]